MIKTARERKWYTCVLIVIVLIGLTGCSFIEEKYDELTARKISVPRPAAYADDEENEENHYSLSFDEMEVEEKVLLDTDEVRVVLTKVYRHNKFGGPSFVFNVKNNTDRKLFCHTPYIAVNGMELQAIGGVIVDPGEEAEGDEICGCAYKKLQSHFDEITDAEFRFVFYENEGADIYWLPEPVSVSFPAPANYDSTIDESGTLAYDDNGVQIVVKEPIWYSVNPAVPVYIQNMRDDYLIVQTDSLLVNGIQVSGQLDVLLFPGKKAMPLVNMDVDELSQAGISSWTDIKNISISFRINQRDNVLYYDNQIDTSIPVTIEYDELSSGDPIIDRSRELEGTVLYNENGVSVLLKSIERDDPLGSTKVTLQAKNSSSKEQTIRLDHLYVNGCHFRNGASSFSLKLAPGETAEDAISLYDSHLEKLGIETVSTLDFGFYRTDQMDEVYRFHHTPLTTVMIAEGDVEPNREDGIFLEEVGGVRFTLIGYSIKKDRLTGGEAYPTFTFLVENTGDADAEIHLPTLKGEYLESEGVYVNGEVSFSSLSNRWIHAGKYTIVDMTIRAWEVDDINDVLFKFEVIDAETTEKIGTMHACKINVE